MTNVWVDSELALECIRQYGNHDAVVKQWGHIGFVEFCRRCGVGRWHNLKSEVRLEEGIHYHSSGGKAK